VRVPGLGSKLRVMALELGLSLCILPLHTSFGQERGQPLIPLATPFRISVASNVDERCVGTIRPSVIQQDAEAQLRGVGVTVLGIHNAQLAIDVYCAPVTPGSRKTAVVVRECIDFSEVVPATANHGRAMSATTFRNCQSLVCRGANCESLVGSGLHTLLNPFLKDLQDRIEGRSVFYLLYIMTCVTVLLYWQCRGHHFRL
jgi:hypothetical protein